MSERKIGRLPDSGLCFEGKKYLKCRFTPKLVRKLFDVLGKLTLRTTEDEEEDPA